MLVDRKSNYTKKPQQPYQQLSLKTKRNGKNLYFEHKHHVGTSYTFQAQRRLLPEDSLSSFPPLWPSTASQMRTLGFEKAVTSLVTANKYLK